MTANASETSDTSGSDNDQASDKDEGRRLSFEVVADLTADGSSLYTYRDFSNVAEEELEDVSASLAPPSHHGRAETSIRCQKFPVKLYAILAQKEFNEIITWQPHGRAWKVLEPQSFERLVMPLFFEYSNYHSFNRLVNAWSFRRISSGPDRGSYYHEVCIVAVLIVGPTHGHSKLQARWHLNHCFMLCLFFLTSSAIPLRQAAVAKIHATAPENTQKASNEEERRAQLLRS